MPTMRGVAAQHTSICSAQRHYAAGMFEVGGNFTFVEDSAGKHRLIETEVDGNVIGPRNAPAGGVERNHI